MSRILIVDQGVSRIGLRLLIVAQVPHAKVLEADRFEVWMFDELLDLVLIDTASAETVGTDFPKKFRQMSPTCRIALVSDSRARADILKCLSAGYHGFVCKTQADDDIIEDITDLLRGRIRVPVWLADVDNCVANNPSPISKIEQFRLTPRQLQILLLISKGASDKEIARKLNIAVATVRVHTRALIKAIGVRNRTEAAFRASKYVSLDGDSI
jgi:DNA-binding NarL/FixJ family response regulator